MIDTTLPILVTEKLMRMTQTLLGTPFLAKMTSVDPSIKVSAFFVLIFGSKDMSS